MKLCAIADLAFQINELGSRLFILTASGTIIVAKLCDATENILSISPIFTWNGIYSHSKLMKSTSNAFIYDSTIAIFDDEILICIYDKSNDCYIFELPNIIAYENKAFHAINQGDYEIKSAMQASNSSFVASFQGKETR